MDQRSVAPSSGIKWQGSGLSSGSGEALSEVGAPGYLSERGNQV